MMSQQLWANALASCGAIGVVIIVSIIISLSGVVALEMMVIIIIDRGGPRGIRHKRHILF